MDTHKKYFIIHNNKLKYTSDTLDEAIKLVEKKVNKIVNYYQNELQESVYNIMVNIETLDKDEIRYDIIGNYKFTPIEVNTVFETFKII
jgi:hypothetical protein